MKNQPKPNGRPRVVTLKYLGTGTKKVELPVPLMSLSAKTGEVICDPYGDFPPEDAERLLEIMPHAFERVNEKHRWGVLEKEGEVTAGAYILSKKARYHFKKRQYASILRRHAKGAKRPSPAEPEGQKELSHG